MKAGDFTGLASDYSLHRPDYSPEVLHKLLSLLPRPVEQIDFVDVGAGTGIWTRMVHAIGVKSAIAIEPNEDMLSHGQIDSSVLNMRWMPGSAESTGLTDHCCDWVSMASSFHWADFDKAMTEFHRILRPGGIFTALWNPRLIEVNPLLVEIENHLKILRPEIKRISSGRSGITETIHKQLQSRTDFESVKYIEGTHVIKMDQARYIGAWRSVNDLQVQLGSIKFEQFLSYVQNKIEELPFIEATYLTRSWSVRKK